MKTDSANSTITSMAAGSRRARRAFTLIELLVVISIIAVLVGLVLAVMPGTANWRTRRAVEAQKQQLITLIERYREELGYYPPCNVHPGTRQGSSSTNLLFYELAGATNRSPVYTVFGRPDLTLTENQIASVYAMAGLSGRNRIFNSAVPPDLSVQNIMKKEQRRAYDPDASPRVRSMHAEIKRREYKTAANGIVLFTAPAAGPEGDFNPWHYVVPGTHNPQSFDLWIDVLLGGQTNRLGNWKKAK